MHGHHASWNLAYGAEGPCRPGRPSTTPTPGTPPQVKVEKKKTTAYKANTCDLCTQLSVPSCVYACPHDAAKRVDPQRFFGDVLEAQADFLKGSWTPERHYETHTTH